ncbi:MAG: hypothetical protein AB7E23_05815 [Bacilli bacterium]
MITKKITSVLTSVFAMFTVLFFILAHVLVGEGMFLPAVGLALSRGLLFLITPTMAVAYLVVAAIILISLIVAIVWIIKLIKIKGKFFDFIQPFIFLFSIILSLLVVSYREALATFYNAEATRLVVFYLIAATLFIMAYGLHLMVFGLVNANHKQSDEAMADVPTGLTEQEVRQIVQDELNKIEPVVVKETVIKKPVQAVKPEKKEDVVEELESSVEEVENKVEEVEQKEVMVEAQSEPVVAPLDEIKEEPVAAAVVKKVSDEGEEFERLTFEERIATFDEDSLAKYYELKEYMLSYGVKSRLSSTGDSFRANRNMYFKITNSGNSGFKVYFKLDLPSYEQTTFPLKDASGIKMYEEVPAFMYLKSDLSLKRCKELVDDVMLTNGFVRKD